MAEEVLFPPEPLPNMEELLKFRIPEKKELEVYLVEEEGVIVARTKEELKQGKGE